MEFGVSPMPETRRRMMDRRTLFDVPAYRWIPARTRVIADYWIVTGIEESIPESLRRPDAAATRQP
jgi:hypothetical protein